MQTHWIGGKAFASEEAAEIPVVNPATEETIDTIPQGCDKDVEATVDAAQDAFSAWAALAPGERRPFFWKIAEKLQQHQIARLLTMENGKPYKRVSWEAGRLAQIAVSDAELAVHFRCGVQSAPFENLVFQHRVPRGVAACVMPWNYPLDLSFEGMMPCPAAGNTVVWKPSEKTPLSTRLLAELVFDGMPPGVVNVLLGDGAPRGSRIGGPPRDQGRRIRRQRPHGEIDRSRLRRTAQEMRSRTWRNGYDDDVIQKCSAKAADHAFSIGVLPGRSRRRGDLMDT